MNRKKITWIREKRVFILVALMFGLISLLLIFVVFQVWRGAGGRASYLKRLQHDLVACEQQNLLDAATRERLIAYLSNRPHVHRLKAVTALSLVAGFCVLAGVCLLIAHNWERLSESVRVAGFCVLYLAAVEGTLWCRQRHPIAHRMGEMIWLFLPLLGIGLYGQTFHLEGDLIRPYVVSLALSLPLAWLTQTRAIQMVYGVCGLLVIFSGNFFARQGDLSLLIAYGVDPAPVPFLAWVLTALVWLAAGAVLLKALESGKRFHLLGIFFLWIFMLLVNRTPLEIKHGGWWMVAVMSLSTLWILLPGIFGGREGEKNAGKIAWLGSLYGLTFMHHGRGSYQSIAGSSWGVGVVIALSFLAVIAIFSLPKTYALQKYWRWFLQGVLVLGLGLAYAVLIENKAVVYGVAYFANFMFAGIAIASIFYGASHGTSSAINAGVAMLVLLIVTRFIDLFGTMLASGMGFIVSGLLLAALAFGVEKGRKHLLIRARAILEKRGPQ